jgi:deoxycytidylate deaminase
LKEFIRVNNMMDCGNQARETSRNNAILALGVAKLIAKARSKKATSPRRAFLIHSLKHPDEVSQLRRIYPRGFYLVGVHADPNRKLQYLINKGMTKKEANALMGRDLLEDFPHGQRIVHTFHLADFFVRLEPDNDRLKNSLWRIVDILFGDMHKTPNFGEYAMFLAFSASLRSGDLSRQVGAVIARDGDILGTGANDCPRAGGGLYWPEFDRRTQSIRDAKKGRDAMRGYDSNVAEQRALIAEIVSKCRLEDGNANKIKSLLEHSAIRDLTEFGRVVHAEMEALLSCARKGVSTVGTTMYCTTFPCHNCAKHIIAAGVRRVVFIEPYLKSKAIKLHDDALKITHDERSRDGRGRPRFVLLEPFVGVGPRRFFDLFSTRLGMGVSLSRKDNAGKATKWEVEGATLRIPMLVRSHLEEEAVAAEKFDAACAPGKTPK